MATQVRTASAGGLGRRCIAAAVTQGTHAKLTKACYKFGRRLIAPAKRAHECSIVLSDAVAIAACYAEDVCCCYLSCARSDPWRSCDISHRISTVFVLLIPVDWPLDTQHREHDSMLDFFWYFESAQVSSVYP